MPHPGKLRRRPGKAGWAPLILALALLAGCTPRPAAPNVQPASLPPPVLTRAGETPPPLPDPTATALPEPTAAPLPSDPADLARSEYGDRLIEWARIDSIDVYAPVTPVGWQPDPSPDDPLAVEWESPGARVGWALGSALPGDPDGTVILYGHNNINSRVFQNLADVQPGDLITLSTGQRDWVYEVDEVTILPVLQGDADRAAYKQYLSPGLTPRLALISCWPPDNNTHRVVVVAFPRARAEMRIESVGARRVTQDNRR